MGRVIGSALLGYVVMFVIVFVLFTVSWLALGMDGAFQPGLYDPSMAWIVATVIVGLVASFAGGKVAGIVARGDKRALYGLIGIVLVMGVVAGILPMMQKAREPSPARPAEVTMMEAMQQARTPLWLAVLNPLIGVAGAFAGFGSKKPAVTAAA